MLTLLTYQQDFLRALNAARVEYLVIGGKAMQAHRLGRTSFDLDIWVSNNIANARRLNPVLTARTKFPIGHRPSDLTVPGRMVQIRNQHDQHVIDVLTSLGDLDFATVDARKLRLLVYRMFVPVASIPDLINMKEISQATTEDPRLAERDGRDIELMREHLAARPS
ncbi:hypothetical protein [Paraburkholderia caffeinilytica]|uniref:Nucleotidyl transferase AbiEii/AbiGii toxin family protein n=1 Tax=Paraburkholderia caffeinilytica TaxID=1761016 RepID=A0ABQ1L6J8_9BURK|nr:hypothetical protein [Paraburkholderia caffeinilytica]GGC20361.1 hypothetical protein GCM10011400_03350 [Paraburkholderia caffeinilytica]CAB3778600.1 hypothetical protein LMG28690_00736 [Paraburkholderia caffeinilytica]